MTTSVIRQATQEKNIPFRHIQDNQELSSTPGGTIYSTTPGGTRIVYDRTFLLSLRNSPLSRTPPKFGAIPTFLLKDTPAQNNDQHIPTVQNRQVTIPVQPNSDEPELFSMDI